MEKDNLLSTVCSIFENESLTLTVENQRPVFTVKNWQRIATAFEHLKFPSFSERDFPRLEADTFSVITLSTEHCGQWIEPVIEIELTNLYSFVTCSLAAHGQIPFDKELNCLRYLVEHRAALKQRLSPTAAHCLKSWLNFYYGCRSVPESSSTIAKACAHVRSKIVAAMPFGFFCEEPDTLFFGNVPETAVIHLKQYMDYMKLPHEITVHRGGIFLGKKKYVLVSDKCGIILKGIERATF